MRRLKNYIAQYKLLHNNYVHYRIVDFENKNANYKVQCINTKVFLHFTATELMMDLYILERLHPIQSCYLGLKHANDNFIDFNNIWLKSRYGKYKLQSQMRNLDIEVVKIRNNEALFFSLEEIIQTALIKNFDSIQALYLGIMMGKKINRIEPYNNRSTDFNLKLIK